MKFISSLSLKVKIIIAACAVAAAAAVGTVIILNSEEAYRVIKVFELNGSATVARENTGDIDAYAGMNLESGDVLSVEKSSTMQISLDSDKYILLDGGTVLRLIARGTAAGSKTVIDLQEGTILNEIKNSLSANSSYEVNTPKATIAVRGTVFKVTTQENPDGSFVTDLYTTENTVSVQLYDENGDPKGEEIYVPEGGAVTILTEVNGETGNSADVDGDPHFVFRESDGSLTDCGDSDPVYFPADKASAEVQAEKTVTTVTETIAAAEEKEPDAYEKAILRLRDAELEKKEVKWFACYDITSGLEETLFNKKYGGYLTWIPTTWENRHDDLSEKILGGAGVDLCERDTANLPYGITDGMFEPIDKYTDLNDAVWADTRAAMENYRFGDKHFMFVTNVKANYFVYYNIETIKEYGMEDPWELYKSGRWNWDTFKSMLEEFVDEDKERFGLDHWCCEGALAYSAGACTVRAADGRLVSGIRDALFDKAVSFQYDLYQSGLVYPMERFDRDSLPQLMGEKKELFWIGGFWEAYNAPETWEVKIPPENLRIVPTPSPAGSVPYQAAFLDGSALCKGAANPVGAALFSECSILANSLRENDEYFRFDYRQSMMESSRWSEEFLDRLEEIDSLAKKYPVVDHAKGCVYDTDNSEYAVIEINSALRGTDWSAEKDAIASNIENKLYDLDKKLQSKTAEFN